MSPRIISRVPHAGSPFRVWRRRSRALAKRGEDAYRASVTEAQRCQGARSQAQPGTKLRRAVLVAVALSAALGTACGGGNADSEDPLGIGRGRACSGELDCLPLDEGPDGQRTRSCALGTFDHDQNPATSCVPKTVCPAGTRVADEGSAVTDRSCESCANSTFSEEDNAATCVPHSSCGVGTFTSKEGTPTADRVCELCPPGTQANAGQAGCAPCPAGAFCPGGATAASVCGAGMYDHDQDSKTACEAKSDCVPGTHRTSEGTTTVDRDCAMCVDSFTAKANEESCTPWTDCLAGTFIAADPTTTTDRVCNPCNSGSFSAGRNASACQPWSPTCGSGEFEAVAANAKRDRVCRPITQLVSVSTRGGQSNETSGAPSVSADGRFVAYASEADNLVPGDTNDRADVFLRDLDKGTTTRISISSAGTQGNHDSIEPVISANGRFVAYRSRASNLVPGDTNRSADIFVFDRKNKTTTRVSVRSDGGQANSFSWNPSLSGDGRFVAFDSFASNLVANDTNQASDVFVFDRQNQSVSRVSLSQTGAQANDDCFGSQISSNAATVAFVSSADNLTRGDENDANDVFIRDRTEAITLRVSLATDADEVSGDSYAPSLSADGQIIAFTSEVNRIVPGDNNDREDVFVFSRKDNTLVVISFSGNGRQRGNSGSPSVSSTGRFVAFQSAARNLVSEDSNRVSDIFVHDLQKRTTRRASLSSSGNQANGPSFAPHISANGDFVVYVSEASNLVDNDDNDEPDVFITRLGN